MARPRKQNGASRPGQEGGKAPRTHIKTSFNFDCETHKLLTLGSLETGLDMTELLTKMIHNQFGGWHVRKAPRSRAGEAPLDFAMEDDSEQGEGTPDPVIAAPAPRKRPPGAGGGQGVKDSRNFGVLTERSAHLDHDKAVEDLASAHDRIIEDLVEDEEAA